MYLRWRTICWPNFTFSNQRRSWRLQCHNKFFVRWAVQESFKWPTRAHIGEALASNSIIFVNSHYLSRVNNRKIVNNGFTIYLLKMLHSKLWVRIRCADSFPSGSHSFLHKLVNLIKLTGTILVYLSNNTINKCINIPWNMERKLNHMLRSPSSWRNCNIKQMSNRITKLTELQIIIIKSHKVKYYMYL